MYLRKGLSVSICWGVIAALAVQCSAFAGGKPPVVTPDEGKTPPAAKPDPAPLPPLVLNPDTLRERLLAGNMSVLVELNTVYQAKTQVGISRGNLLPSINIGAVAGSFSNPSFVLSSVSFLLPFLLPSNWFNLRQSEHLLDAELDSYYLMELNQYASAYSLYETIVADQQLLKALQDQYVNLEEIAEVLEGRQQATGKVNPGDTEQAENQASLASVQLSRMKELVNTEKASMRQLLDVPLNQDMTFAEVHVPSSDAEGATPAAILPMVEKIAPELHQIQALYDAGNSAVKGKIWAFLTGASLSGQAGTLGPPPKNAGFVPQVGGANVNLGFSYFPTIQFAKDARDQLKAEQKQIDLEEQFLTENALEALIEVQKQVADAQTSEKKAKIAFDIKHSSYFDGKGSTDLLTVLSTETAVVAASTARIQAQLDLDNMRINLHRLLLTDQFAKDKIQGCQLNADAAKKLSSGGVFAWIKDTLNPSRNRVTIDQACHVAIPAAGAAKPQS